MGKVYTKAGLLKRVEELEEKVSRYEQELKDKAYHLNYIYALHSKVYDILTIAESYIPFWSRCSYENKVDKVHQNYKVKFDELCEKRVKEK